MHIFVQERGMFLPKHAGGSGMGDRACKTSFFGGFGAPKSLLLLSRLTSSLLARKWDHVALFWTLLSQYVSVGELTEEWKRLGEYMPMIKSSETQFCKPFLSSKTLRKPTKWATEGYDISLRSFWQVLELKRSSYDHIMAVLRIQLQWISAPGEYRESSFQGKLIAGASHLSPLRMTYYFACI